MKTFRSFLRIVDHQTVMVTVLSLVSTWVCLRWGLLAELPSALIGIAVIFPIVFSINSAYRRREEVLRYLASAKAHGVAIAWAHRDWLEDAGPHARRGFERIEALFEALRAFFQDTEVEDMGQGESVVGGDAALEQVYRCFSDLSRSHEALRAAGMPANEVSRINQYLRAMMIDFERMRNILDYRTPIALRAYSRLFLNGFPILYGPYFATLAVESIPAVGYGVAFIYSVVLVSLDNIQEALENPYDTLDEDDVDVDLGPELRAILALGAGDSRPSR